MNQPAHPLSSVRPYPAALPREGDVVAGRYRVEQTLGIGGMGVVVSAVHLELDERVAIKFLASVTPPGPEAVARFVREAKAAIKIRSDHVVRVLDSGKLESGAPFIVMEYLDGRDLQAVLEQHGALGLEQAVDYLLQACDAIAAAHALGIVHRDLKPGNLFLTRRSDGSPLVKVLDFGISKVMDGAAISGSGLTSTTTVMGTPAFMSPEQLRSARHVDPRADIWSMGTILYALLAGEPPYSGESTADIAVKIIRDPTPPLRERRPDIPEGIEAVIARCLEKEPDARYAGVAELADALLPFASDMRRASAQRITKQISARQLGAAPTLVSGPGPASRIEASEPATRTANAWGKPATKSVEIKPRRRALWAGVIAAVTVSAAAATFVLVKARTSGGPATSVSVAEVANAPSPTGPQPAVAILAAAPPATTALDAPTLAAPTTPPATPAAPSPTASVRGAASTARGPAKSGGRSTAPPPRPSAAISVAPVASPAPAPSAGLFDDRE
jgi:serine/threonine-protein kinase